MAEHTYQHHQSYDQNQLPNNNTRQMVKTATAVTAGGSLLVLSGLTMAVTVIALTIVTPLLVIFSPILVPAVITVSLLTLGFLTSGGFGVAAVSVLTWIYSYVTGKHPTGADELERARTKLSNKAREMKERAAQQQQQTGIAVS